MSRRILFLLSLTALCAGAAQAQTAKPYVAPKTAFGQPDIQGTWTNESLTVLQRDTKYGERLVLSEAEVREIEAGEEAARVAGNAPTDPKLTIKDLPVDCGRGFSGTNCGYNSGWVAPGDKVMRVNGEPRSSFITTEKNGRVPARKAAAAPARPGGLGPGGRRDDNPETMSAGERCLTSFGNSAGPVMLPLLYNNNYQIVQSRDSVAILVEMVHDVRIVRLNGTHRTDGVRPWYGDSVGRWQGDTLVVETTNYPRANAFQGAWEDLKVTEKFTRRGKDRLHYAFTVESPSTWDKPWGGEYEFSPTDGHVYEYACHEGNYALEGILAGAREEARQAAAARAAR